MARIASSAYCVIKESDLKLVREVKTGRPPKLKTESFGSADILDYWLTILTKIILLFLFNNGITLTGECL